MSAVNLFDAFLQRWNLRVDGEPLATHSGHLLPVRLDGHLDGRPAMIETAQRIDDRIGGRVMRWWNGDGAARVYAFDEEAGALLMQRAVGPGHLLRMAREGEDEAATRAVCRVISRLHAKRPNPPMSEQCAVDARVDAAERSCWPGCRTPRQSRKPCRDADRRRRAVIDAQVDQGLVMALG